MKLHPKLWSALLLTGLIFCQSGLARANTCRSNNPNWYTCQSDSDCVMIYNPCGWPTEASSLQFAEEAKRCNRHAGAVLDCAEYNLEAMGVYRAQCSSGICVAVKLP